MLKCGLLLWQDLLIASNTSQDQDSFPEQKWLMISSLLHISNKLLQSLKSQSSRTIMDNKLQIMNHVSVFFVQELLIATLETS